MEYCRTGKSIDIDTKEKFNNSECVEKILLLLNNTFDTMNAQCPREGIRSHNWSDKKNVYKL